MRWIARVSVGFVVALLIGVLIWEGTHYPSGPFVTGRIPFPASPCSLEERRVLAEFPQYGDAGVRPENGYAIESSCAVFYDTPDSQEHVYEYFREQLTRNGWTVEGMQRCYFYSGTCLQAHRNGFVYEVKYIKEGTNVNVHLAEL